MLEKLEQKLMPRARESLFKYKQNYWYYKTEIYYNTKQSLGNLKKIDENVFFAFENNQAVDKVLGEITSQPNYDRIIAQAIITFQQYSLSGRKPQYLETYHKTEPYRTSAYKKKKLAREFDQDLVELKWKFMPALQGFGLYGIKPAGLQQISLKQDKKLSIGTAMARLCSS